MPHLSPSWQLSLTLCAGFLLLWGIATAVARSRSGQVPRPVAAAAGFGREFALVCGLLGLYQYVGRFAHTRVDGAFANARGVWDVERTLGLPSEVWLQHLFLPVPLLVKALNAYYLYAHLNSMVLFVLWMFWRHREAFARARNVVVLSTLTCLLVQLVPVAPPRMLRDLGFVDTALRYGQSVYGAFGSGIADQLAAMPSVHVAWAVIVGGFVLRYAPAPWRWFGPVHTALTVLVVVVTANHWWLDGIVAAGIVATAVAVQGGAEALLARRRPVAVPAVAPHPVPARVPAAEPVD